MEAWFTKQFKRPTTRLDQMDERIGNIEEPHATRSEPKTPRPTPLGQSSETPRPIPPIPRAQLTPPDPRGRCQHREITPDPIPRCHNPDVNDQEERILRSIRLDAPIFEGSLDPKVYTDWESDMDQYFEWYEMSEERKFKFAKLRLVRRLDCTGEM